MTAPPLFADTTTDSTLTDARQTRAVNFHHIKDTPLWDRVNHRFTDDNYVYCGRRNATYGLPESIWHNPFKGDGAIEKFREYLVHSPHIHRLAELRGKVLVCWCKPKACHCDVLVEAIEGGGNTPRRFLFEDEPDDEPQLQPAAHWLVTEQTRYENAYSDPVHNAYLRSNSRAAARRHHAADGALSRRLAHECGLSLAYGVRVGTDGRLTRCYGAAMKAYWER